MTKCHMSSLCQLLFSELNLFFFLSFTFSWSQHIWEFLEGGEGSNLCNTAVIFDYILKTINDHFVLIS